MGTPNQDAGYAWVVCAASFFIMMIHGGLIYCMGILYIMFQDGLDAGDTALSLITSLNISMIYIFSPLAGLLNQRFGERLTGMAGGFIGALGLALSSSSSQVYQLYMTYCVVGGIGMGMVLNPCLSILATYFIKYRRIATGIAMSGVGVGSFAIPPIVKALEDRYGWRGAILMIGGLHAQIIFLFSLYRPMKYRSSHHGNRKCMYNDDVNSNLHSNKTNSDQVDQNIKADTAKNSDETILTSISKTTDFQLEKRSVTEHEFLCRSTSKDRDEQEQLSENPKTRKNKGGFKGCLSKSFSLFKGTHFRCLCFCTMMNQVPLVIVYTHAGRYVLSLGYVSKDVVLVYIAMGVSSTISRVLVGILTELTHMNCFKLLSICSIVNGALTILLPLTDDLNIIYAYAILYGALTAPYNALNPTMVTESVPKSQVATAYGIQCFFRVPGTAFGAPLAAWLHGFTNMYASAFYLAGTFFILSAVVMLPALCIPKSRKEP